MDTFFKGFHRSRCWTAAAEVNEISIKSYMRINAESVEEGQDFGIGSILGSICIPISINHI